MKVSKKLQKKRKANKRNIGIAACVLVIVAALVVIFWPNNNTNNSSNNSYVANQNTNATIVTNNTETASKNIVANTNNNTSTQNTVESTTTSNNNTSTSNSNQSNSSSSGWSLFNWGSKEVDENKAKEIAVEEFAKLGETVTVDQLQVYPLERKDGLIYFYIKSPKNTCEVRKDDGVVTRLNAQVVNE